MLFRSDGRKQEWWADNDNDNKGEEEKEQEEIEENKGDKIVLFFTLRFFCFHFLIEFSTKKIAVDRTRQSDKQEIKLREKWWKRKGKRKNMLKNVMCWEGIYAKKQWRRW